MNWDTLTIGEYQRILELLDGVTDEVSSSEAEELILVEIGGYTHEKLQEMPIWEFNKLFEKEFGFLSEGVPPTKPVKVLVAGNHIYHIQYDATKITKGQYDEVVAFSKNGVNATLHQFMASITKPVWWWWGYKDHEDRSKDMKKVKFIHAYYASVFFWKVYKELLQVLQTSLASKIQEMTEEQKLSLSTQLTSLSHTGAGTRTTSK
jgi:hypothetical protein